MLVFFCAAFLAFCAILQNMSFIPCHLLSERYRNLLFFSIVKICNFIYEIFLKLQASKYTKTISHYNQSYESFNVRGVHIQVIVENLNEMPFKCMHCIDICLQQLC